MILFFFIFKFEKSPILHNGHVMGWFASSLLWTIIGRVAMFLGFFHKRKILEFMSRNVTTTVMQYSPTLT